MVARLTSCGALIGVRLVHGATRLARAGRLTLLSLLPNAGLGDSQCPHRLLVNLPACLEALLALELNECRSCALAQEAVRLADIEPLLVQDDLHLPNLIPAELHYHTRTLGSGGPILSACAG